MRKGKEYSSETPFSRFQAQFLKRRVGLHNLILFPCDKKKTEKLSAFI